MVVYYTCLNDQCSKQGQAFLAGDPDHQNCERELWDISEDRGVPQWVWFGASAALAILAAATVFYLRSRQSQKPERKSRHDWSAHETGAGTRGHSVPPPIRAETP